MTCILLSSCIDSTRATGARVHNHGASSVGLVGEGVVSPIVTVIVAQIEASSRAAHGDDIAVGDQGHQGDEGGHGDFHCSDYCRVLTCNTDTIGNCG